MTNIEITRKEAFPSRLRVCSVATSESIWRLQNQSDLKAKSESDAIVR